MKVQVLVSALKQDVGKMPEQMNLESDAIIINQCEEDKEEKFLHKGREILVFHRNERGVGKSRNLALEKADKDICLFSDDDMIYENGYEESIIKEFEENPQADMIVFNVIVGEGRKTFENTERKRVHWYNCGRYGAVSFAIRTQKLREYGVKYSLLFGGGAKYSSGEDSLFIRDLIKQGCQVYTSPVTIGRERESESTWFRGYNEKYFYDRGVLYCFLYDKIACAMAIRFLIAHKNKMCNEISVIQAYKLMCSGIKQGKREKRSLRGK